jgi:hypothetical protein
MLASTALSNSALYVRAAFPHLPEKPRKHSGQLRILAGGAKNAFPSKEYLCRK